MKLKQILAICLVVILVTLIGCQSTGEAGKKPEPDKCIDDCASSYDGCTKVCSRDADNCNKYCDRYMKSDVNCLNDCQSNKNTCGSDCSYELDACKAVCAGLPPPPPPPVPQ
jgi:hypothetical protein